MAAFEAKHRSPSAAEIYSEARSLVQFQPRQLFPEEASDVDAPKTHAPVLSSIKRRSKVIQRVRAVSDEWSPKKHSDVAVLGGTKAAGYGGTTPDNALVRKRVQRKRNSNPSNNSIAQVNGLVDVESPKASPKKGVVRRLNSQLEEAKEVKPEQQQTRKSARQQGVAVPAPVAEVTEALAKRNDDKIISELEKASAHARLNAQSGATVHKFALWQKAKNKASEHAVPAKDVHQVDASDGYFARHLRQAIGQAQAQESITLSEQSLLMPTMTDLQAKHTPPARRRSSRLRTLIEQLDGATCLDETADCNDTAAIRTVGTPTQLPAVTAASKEELPNNTSTSSVLEDSIQEDEELKRLALFPIDSQEEIGANETIAGSDMYIDLQQPSEHKSSESVITRRTHSPPLSIVSGDGDASEGWSDDAIQLPAVPAAPAQDHDTPTVHRKGQQFRVTFPIASNSLPSAAKHRRRPSYNELQAKDVLERSTSDGNSRIPWRQGEVVGTGTFGKVYRGLNTKTGELLAIKQVCLAEGTEEEVAVLRKEITLMHSLRHPHIVRYLGTDMSDRYLYILLEYVPGGSIASLLSTFGPFDEPLTRKFTYQILLGVRYLHERGIMHRDIKGANVLVTDQGVAKLADFGCSKQLQGMCTASLEESLQSIRGSVPWMAPEVIKQTGHGRSADIWSLGATMIEMTTASHPWPNFANNLAAMFHVATSAQPPPIPDQLSNAAKSFMRRCLQVDPDGRGTAADLCRHEFVLPEEANYRETFGSDSHLAQAKSSSALPSFITSEK